MTWLYNNVLLPLCHPGLYRGLSGRLRRLEAFDSLSRQEQLAAQEERVLAMLDHAYHTSPYYRLVFDEMCFRASDWKQGLPIPVPELTRELLRTNREDIPSRAIHSAPISLRSAQRHDLEAARDRAALELYLHRLAGYYPGMRALSMSSSDTEDRESSIDRFLLNRTFCAAALPDGSFGHFLDQLNRRIPDILCGDASTLALCSSWIAASGRTYHRPRLIVASSDAPQQEEREIIQQTFEAPVAVLYRGRDIGILGYECAQGGRIHLHPAAAYVELMPAGRSPEGSLYRLLVTDLLNFATPLIRYDTGVCAQLDESPCACGSAWPSVIPVPGRVADNLVLPDGSLLAGAPLVDRAFRTIRQVQLVQKTVERIHLRYSARGQDPVMQRELARFLYDVEEAFGSPIQWTIERVSEIPRDPSGRLRIVICEVTRDEPVPEWKKAG